MCVDPGGHLKDQVAEAGLQNPGESKISHNSVQHGRAAREKTSAGLTKLLNFILESVWR